MSLQMGTEVVIAFAINQTDTLAGTPYEIVAPVSGFIHELGTTIQAAVGTGGYVDVKTGAALANTVPGIQQTIPDAAAVGSRRVTKASGVPSSRQVSKGDRIAIVPSASFATSGAINGYLKINTGQ